MRIAIGAAKGLQYLHKQNIIHRDMRPNNILVTHDYEALVNFPPRETIIMQLSAILMELIKIKISNTSAALSSFRHFLTSYHTMVNLTFLHLYISLETLASQKQNMTTRIIQQKQESWEH